MARSLSKSKLQAYRQCPKRLWLEVHRPDLKEDSQATRASYSIGNQVGDIARQIYDPKGKGVLIDPFRDGFARAFEQTCQLMTQNRPVFEAAFTAEGALALADVMLPSRYKGKLVWKMVEVKSSTSVKDYHRDDVAIQTYVATRAGVSIKHVALACIDSSWVYPGNNDYQGLLYETDLTEEAVSRQQEVVEWIKKAHKIVAKRKEPQIDIGPQCDDPFECGFYPYCSKDCVVAKQSVYWLPRICTNALKTAIEEDQIIEIADAPDELLNDTQLRVKQCTLNNEIYFDAEGAKEDLAGCRYPYYFIDFETIQFAVPIWPGTRPYQQIPFQFSLRRLSKEGEPFHYELLRIPEGEDPSRDFAEVLVKQCGDTGSVFVYNAGFEMALIRELAQSFPDLSDDLLAINDRIVDLLPIARARYYHPGQHGSWSIKKVLPAIAPDLSYDELNGVQDGGMAMDALLEAIHPDTSEERVKEIMQQLLEYCGLDTQALVRLWAFFSGQSTEKG